MNAVAAADTLAMVWGLVNRHIHFTNFCTGTAASAFILINAVFIKGQLIEQGIECTKGTDPFAKWSIKEYRKRYDTNQEAAFPSEKCA